MFVERSQNGRLLIRVKGFVNSFESRVDDVLDRFIEEEWECRDESETYFKSSTNELPSITRGKQQS